MDTLKIRDHTVIVSQSDMILQDLSKGSLTAVPAEIEELREFIGTIWRMTSLPVVPSEIFSRTDLFRCSFSDDQVAEVKRTNELQGNSGFKFKTVECPWVIDLMDLGCAKMRDLFTLDPTPRQTNASTFEPRNSDIFEGREDF